MDAQQNESQGHAQGHTAHCWQKTSVGLIVLAHSPGACASSIVQLLSAYAALRVPFTTVLLYYLHTSKTDMSEAHPSTPQIGHVPKVYFHDTATFPQSHVDDSGGRQHWTAHWRRVTATQSQSRDLAWPPSNRVGGNGLPGLGEAWSELAPPARSHVRLAMVWS